MTRTRFLPLLVLAMLVNILDNAVKYSPETPKIEVKTELLKNQILVSIRDEGAGMSKAVLKKVFESCPE